MILLRRSLPSVRSLPPLHTRSYQLRCHSSGTIEAREPLRVLFCGSDEFSIASLRALHELHQQDRSIIASIDVVHKPGKRTGRGLKTIKEVPIRKVAEEELLLPTHVINTFTGWQPPDINLIVAVSFGLFVPPRILKSSKFGGLNVHPSLLPDLRGPSPIPYALLLRRPFTGVSLQTLDPHTLDHGTVLAQTDAVPITHQHTHASLFAELAPLGSSLLADGIRRRLYEPPHVDLGWYGKDDPKAPVNHAPKIQKSDAEVKWKEQKQDDILLRHRVLGDLWDTATHPMGKRIIYKSLSPPSAADEESLCRIREALLSVEAGSVFSLEPQPTGKGKRHQPLYFIACEVEEGSGSEQGQQKRKVLRIDSFQLESLNVGKLDEGFRTLLKSTQHLNNSL